MRTMAETAEFLLQRVVAEYFSSVRAGALAALRSGISERDIIDAAGRLGFPTFALAGSVWVQLPHTGRQSQRFPKKEEEENE